MARTFALIAPVHPVLHQVCNYETIPNAPKHYETHQNMNLGSNGLERVRSLRKITTWLRGTNFCINCSSSLHFAPSFMQLRNDTKCTQTLWNAPKHKFRVQWDGSSVFVAKKLQRDFVARTFALIAPIHPVSSQVCRYETIPNAPKHYETHQNMSLGSNGVDRVRSLRKITTRLRGTNFCNNGTSSPCSHWISCSYETIPNAPKDYETHKNMSVGANGVDRVRSLQ